MPGTFIPRVACAALALLAISPTLPQSGPGPAVDPPAHEMLSYNVEWRLIYAGNARLSLDRKREAEKPEWEAKVHLESGGLVSKLYKLDDNYTSILQDQFCSVSTLLDASERSRHHETRVTYDGAKGKASYVERDLIKNSIFKTAEADIPACVSDIIGGLFKMRTLKLEPGQSAQIPTSDGKKTANVRIEAQQREQIKVKAGTFNTIRCEAFVFNGVLYARKGQMLLWLTDDARRLPVQIRVRLSFPVGSITLELEKEEHS